MSPRSTVLSVMLLMSGCATSAPVKPAAKPRAVHAARPAAVAQPAEDEATGEAPDATNVTPAPPPPEAAPPPRPPGATAIDPAAAPGAPKADPFGDVGFKEINEKDWLARIRDNIAQREKIAPTEVRFSPGLLRAAFVRSPPVAAPARPGRRVPLRRHEIVVVDNQGKVVASFRPIVAHGSDEPPAELRFLSEERLVYEVVAARTPPATKAKVRPAARAARTKATRETTRAAPPAAPSLPPRLFVIQPVAPGARPIRCQGFNFTFTRQHDRFAFVGGGQAGPAFVAVDGAQVYPRRGRTIVASAPVWSKDGHSLAFLELPAAPRPARLVLVAEIDDPRGDVTWDLPAESKIDGASVAWAGTGKLVVKKTTTRPIFSASFVTER